MRMLGIAIFGLLCTALLMASLATIRPSGDVQVTMTSTEKPPVMLALKAH